MNHAQENLIELIKTERDRQDEKWGPVESLPANRTPEFWLAILAEEVGEVAEAGFEGYTTEWVREMVQVAAVALAALEWYHCFPKGVKRCVK